MSEQQRQHLSSLVDGELDTMALHTTISALAGSPELKETWEHYHLIGQALRGDTVHPELRQIAERVHAQIAQEPVPLSSAAARRSHRSSRFGAFLGSALAASVAFLAVFAVPQLFEGGSSPKNAAPAVAESTPPPRLLEQFELRRPGQRWNVSQPALENKLDRFLVNHQEYSAASVKGLIPYATFVGYEAGR